jgi:hypothetical protein
METMTAAVPDAMTPGLVERARWVAFIGGSFTDTGDEDTFAVTEPATGQEGSGFGRENALETLHQFVRSKNIRFPSGRGAVPVWPPRNS